MKSKSKKNSLIGILKHHQKNIINYAIDNNDNIHRLFLFHSLGSGKTITSITLAFIYKILNNVKDKIVIVAPLSIIQNFTKEIKFLKLDENLYEIHSYGKFLRKVHRETSYLENRIVILDEIHNYRSNNKGTNELIKATFPAKKVILLTATPIVNSVEDFSTIIAILNKITYSKAMYSLYKPNYIRQKVSMYKVPITELTLNYPQSKTHYIKLYMTDNYYKEYIKVENQETDKLPPRYKEKDYTAFLNGLRRASNKIIELSPKFIWILDKYLTDPQKTLIYSFWKDSGILEMKELFDKAKVKCEVIDGSVSVSRRNEIVEEYNTNKIKVLLITSAGAEGLDLKETRRVVILEPHWNNEKLNQVIGRAVRYNSHKELSESKRQVDIYHLILIKPKLIGLQRLNPFNYNRQPSIDEMLFDIAELKQERALNYIKYIKENSI